MKPNKIKLEEILRLPPGSREEMKRALERVETRLRTDAALRVDRQPEDIGFIPTVNRSWARTALFSAAALLLVAILGRVVWQDTVYGVLSTPDGGSRWLFNETAFGSEGGILTLRDKSRIEIRVMSDLSLHRAQDGVRIQLAKGEVIVNAAKAREGYLYVETKDMTVSVTGTVFVVSAGDTGSRVSVLEGDVQVQHGT